MTVLRVSIGDIRHARLRLHLTWLVCLFVTLIIRLHTFAPQELGLDGALSMDLARSPLRDMLAFNALDVHPPLFYAALKGWMLLASAGFFTAKYLVVLCGVLATALLGAVASRLFTPRVGLLAAPLFVLAPTSVLLGPAVRDFTPGMALSLCCLLLTLTASRCDPAKVRSRRALPWLPAGDALANAAALLTWYFHVVFLLLSVGIALTWSGRRRLAVLGALLVGCVLASPWYVYAVPSLVGKVGRGTTAYGGPPHLPPLGSLAHAVAHGLTGFDSQPWGAVSLVVWLAAIVVGAAASMPGRASRSHARAAGVALAGLALGAGMVGALAARWNASDDLARYVFVLVPFAAILQAAGAVSLVRWQRWIGLSAILALLAAQEGSFVRLVTGTPIDWSHDAAVAQVRQQMRPGDAAIFNDRARHLRFDLGPHAGVSDYVVHSAGQRYLQSTMAQDTERVLAEALPASRRIWYLNAGDPPNTPPVVRKALATAAFVAFHDIVEGTDVSLYEVGLPDGGGTPMANFGNQALLRTARYSLQASPGGAVLVELTWDGLQRFDQPFSVFVHLEAADGKLFAQHDGEPEAGFEATTSWQPGTSILDRHGVPLPPDLPLGVYRLYVGLYHGDARLTLPDKSNQLLVGEISVVAAGP